jgi:dUTP pyrophosphatase
MRGFESVSRAAVEKLIAKIKAEGKSDVITNACIMPFRGSKDSAGYDISTHSEITIKPGEKVLLWTNVKAYMQLGDVLLADVRSSIGTKFDLVLANTIGIIDSDYYNNSSNEGNIGICLKNTKPSMKLTGYDIVKDNGREVIVPQIEDLTDENTVVIKPGERVAQVFFVNFLKSDNCNTEIDRQGGFGSTGR